VARCPNGAGTDAVRRIVYFHGHEVTTDLLVIAAYAFGGALVALLLAVVHERHDHARLSEKESRGHSKRAV
jgi:hypothetical protein